MTTRITFLTGIALLLVLAACGAPDPQATPPRMPIEPSEESFGPDEIPAPIRVHHPKDARGITGCQLLARSQLLDLGLLPDTASNGQAGVSPGCSWKLAKNPDDQAAVAVITDTEEPALLGQYRLHELKPRFSFEPTEVAGHPAVAQRKIRSGPCTIDTGIADDQLMSTGELSNRPADCSLARRMAEAVLSNLPPKR